MAVRVGLRVWECTRALDTRPWTELSTEPGDWRPWPAGGNGEKVVISTGSRILTLLNEALVWWDLEGALGVCVSMASDLGVLGEVCEAMVVISEKGMKFEMRSGEWL